MSSISILAYLILTISIGYAFIYSSMGDLSSLMGQKQKYDDSIIMVNNIENKKEELLAKFNNISATDRKNIETVLPSSLDFVKLVSQIDAVAANYGISVDKVTSKEVNSSVGNSVATAQPQNGYQSSVIGFSFKSSYDKFNAFMNDLGKSMRILDIRSVRLTNDKSGVYSYDVEFETYWLK
jgi:Tfp pilus assembly protein PilO